MKCSETRPVAAAAGFLVSGLLSGGALSERTLTTSSHPPAAAAQGHSRDRRAGELGRRQQRGDDGVGERGAQQLFGRQRSCLVVSAARIDRGAGHRPRTVPRFGGWLGARLRVMAGFAGRWRRRGGSYWPPDARLILLAEGHRRRRGARSAPRARGALTAGAVGGATSPRACGWTPTRGSCSAPGPRGDVLRWRPAPMSGRSSRLPRCSRGSARRRAAARRRMAGSFPHARADRDRLLRRAPRRDRAADRPQRRGLRRRARSAVMRLLLDETLPPELAPACSCTTTTSRPIVTQPPAARRARPGGPRACRV